MVERDIHPRSWVYATPSQETMDLKTLIFKSTSQPDVQQFKHLEESEAARLRAIDPSNKARRALLQTQEDARVRKLNAYGVLSPAENIGDGADKKLIVVLQEIKDRPHTKVCCDTMCFSILFLYACCLSCLIIKASMCFTFH
jgi:hypothetical protein